MKVSRDNLNIRENNTEEAAMKRPSSSQRHVPFAARDRLKQVLHRAMFRDRPHPPRKEAQAET
jgi:hypothetical protein